jgi:hypothetical protein
LIHWHFSSDPTIAITLFALRTFLAYWTTTFPTALFARFLVGWMALRARDKLTLLLR